MNSRPKIGSAANLFWIAAAAIGVFAWGFGFQTWEWYQARKIGESQPCLKFPLRDLPNEAADAAPGTKETFFGYEFEVPWSNVDAQVFRRQAMLTAPNGLALIFWDPADRQQLLDDSRNPVQHPNMKEAFGAFVGKAAAQSNYDLLTHTVSITPGQIGPLLSKREANARLILLNIKSIYCSRNISAFYTSQSKDLRCIQIGQPGVERLVEVSCFDSGDRELNFHFSAQQNPAVLTQLEINRVIQTLHPASIGLPEGTTRNRN